MVVARKSSRRISGLDMNMLGSLGCIILLLLQLCGQLHLWNA